MMYGMPFPGDYLIGRMAPCATNCSWPVTSIGPPHRKWSCGISAPTRAEIVEIKADVLTATVSLSTDRCFPGQELAVSLSIHLKPGWHIYGKPLPDNYQATELLFDGLIVGEQAGVSAF